MKTLYLIVLLIFSIETFCQNISSNKSGNIEFNGAIETKNPNNFELSECISSKALINGIESKTKTGEDAKESSYIKGKYSYSYYVDDYESPAGDIKFKFEYFIMNGKINYKFYDFEHDKSGSKFGSIGLLPLEWGEKVKNTFTESQYAEIMTDITSNILNYIRLINKYCIDE